MLPIAHIEKGALLRLAAVKKSAVVLVQEVDPRYRCIKASSVFKNIEGAFEKIVRDSRNSLLCSRIPLTKKGLHLRIS